MHKLVIAIVAMFALVLGASGAGWDHGQYSPGSYSASVSVPSTAQVTQTFQAFGFGQVVNDGPLGNYNAAAGPQQYYQGNVGAGTYSVYQVVLVSGYSVTVMTW